MLRAKGEEENKMNHDGEEDSWIKRPSMATFGACSENRKGSLQEENFSLEEEIRFRIELG